MSDVFLLTKQPLNRIKPYCPVSQGIPRVDDRRVMSGIIYVLRYGLQMEGCPEGLWAVQDARHRFMRWSRAGIFNKIFRELARQPGTRDCLMIDAPHLKAHRTAA